MKKIKGYQENLENILAMVKISLWDWNVTKNILYCAGSCDCSEYTKIRQTNSADFRKNIALEDIGFINEVYRRCLKGEQDSYIVQFRIYSSHGSIMWIQESGTVVQRDEHGNALRLIGSQQDISHLKNEADMLENQHQHMDIMAELSGQSYWYLDVLTKELVFSNQLEKEFGYAPGELRINLSTWLEWLHPDDSEIVKTALNNYLNGIIPTYRVDLRMRNKQGEYVWVTTSGKIVQWLHNKPWRLAGGLINIHRIKITEQTLKTALEENYQAHQKLQQAYSQMSRNLEDSHADLRRQDLLLEIVNSVAAQLLTADNSNFDITVTKCLRNLGEGVSADRVYIMQNIEINGIDCIKPIYQWAKSERSLWPEEKFFPYTMFPSWRKKLENNESINYTVHSIDGEPRAFFDELGVQSILVIPIFIDNVYWGVIYFADSQKIRLSDEAEIKTLQSGGILVVLSVLRTHTMKQLMAAMQEAQASAKAKTQFLSNMSHEIRTPLNGIIGMCEIAKNAKEMKQVQHCLSRIDTSAKHLLSIINDVLDMSKIDAGKIELSNDTFTIESLVRDIKDIIFFQAKERKQYFHADVDGNLPKAISADRKRLLQVLTNFLSNAVKFTPDGGKITLYIKNHNMQNGNVSIYFEVKDTGIGITKEQQEKLFDAFYQVDRSVNRKYGGTGLGLSISQNLVGMMGGKINVNSQPGKGSSFSFTITVPALKENINQKNEHKNHDDCKGIFKGKHILLAEDIEINREIVIAMLEETEAIIECATDGSMACTMFMLEPTKYDVILMDINMPHMDGYRATNRIRTCGLPNSMTVPIIAMTANVFQEDVYKCLKAGMNDHIGKPVSMTEMVSKIADKVF